MSTKRIFRTGLAIAASLLFMACAGKSQDQAPKFENETGAHAASWVSNHWAEYAKNPDQCSTCHGSLKDPAKAGGVSGVSCFTCHPNGATHPEGWAAGNQHGRLGAQAAPSAFSGFADCAKCHGTSYTGGGIGKTPSCTSCHTKAPHPDKPWLGTNASVSTHYLTQEGNAPECAKCHTNGANSTRVPITPAPANTAPGCFNNTLCHDRNL